MNIVLHRSMLEYNSNTSKPHISRFFDHCAVYAHCVRPPTYHLNMQDPSPRFVALQPTTRTRKIGTILSSIATLRPSTSILRSFESVFLLVSMISTVVEITTHHATCVEKCSRPSRIQDFYVRTALLAHTSSALVSSECPTETGGVRRARRTTRLVVI